MALNPQGFIKIYPSTVSIVSGAWALNSDAAPQPTRTPAALEAYYDLRVPNIANAPCVARNTENPLASGVYVPSVNTYELQFSPDSRGVEFYNSYPGVPTLTADFLSADFPMGLDVNQLSVWVTFRQFFGTSRDRTIGNLNLRYFGSTVYSYPGVAQTLVDGTVSSPDTAIIPSIFTRWSFIQAMKVFGVSIPVTAAVSGLLALPQSVISDCFVLGVYNTAYLGITTTTPDALPGNDIEINSANGTFGNFDIDEFKLYWDTQDDEEDVNPLFPGWTGGVRIPRNLIFVFTIYQIKMRFPNSGIPYGGRRLMLTGLGNSTFFVGEFALQNFNITLVEGSGLYSLTTDKRNDTYYDRSTTPVTTTDLRIPDPFAKTGFFNV